MMTTDDKPFMALYTLIVRLYCFLLSVQPCCLPHLRSRSCKRSRVDTVAVKIHINLECFAEGVSVCSTSCALCLWTFLPHTLLCVSQPLFCSKNSSVVKISQEVNNVLFFLHISPVEEGSLQTLILRKPK